VVEIKEKQTGNGERPSGMGEDCIGSQGPQRTVTLLEKKRRKNAWLLSCFLKCGSHSFTELVTPEI